MLKKHTLATVWYSNLLKDQLFVCINLNFILLVNHSDDQNQLMFESNITPLSFYNPWANLIIIKIIFGNFNIF